MNQTDAVSCLLCLQADEYGSMIKVCVPPGRIPPSSEKVICRLCAAIITACLDGEEGEEIGNVRSDEATVRGDGPAELAGGLADNPEWDSGLPDREAESIGASDSYPGENPPTSSRKRSPRRVAGEKTDD